MDDEERRRFERAEDDRRAEQRREEQRRAHLHEEEAHRRRSLCTSCGLLTAMAAGKCSLCGAAEAEAPPAPVDVDVDVDVDVGFDIGRTDDEAERQARADLIEGIDDEQREALWRQASAGTASYDEARDRFWSLAEQARRSDDLLRAQMAAYSNQFDQTPQLNDLWERACRRTDGERRSYDEARGVFWTSVNHGTDEDARWVRAMLDVAGFELGDGPQAPRLRLETGARRDSLDRADRGLEIDHASPRSRKKADRALETAASNLRFMTGRDNRFRGARYDAQDRRS